MGYRIAIISSLPSVPVGTTIMFEWVKHIGFLVRYQGSQYHQLQDKLFKEKTVSYYCIFLLFNTGHNFRIQYI